MRGAHSQKEGVDVDSSESKGDTFTIKTKEDRESGARSQKEGVDVDSSESKGVTNGGSGHKSHSPPAEKRIAEESTVRYL